MYLYTVSLLLANLSFVGAYIDREEEVWNSCALCIYAAVSRKYYYNIVIIFSRRTCNTLACARFGRILSLWEVTRHTAPDIRIDIAKRQHFPAPHVRSLARSPVRLFSSRRTRLYLFLNTIDIFTVSLLFSALSSLCENKVSRPPASARSRSRMQRLGDPLIRPTPVVHAYFSTCRHCKTRTLYDANKSRELSRPSTFALATRPRQSDDPRATRGRRRGDDGRLVLAA